MAEQATVKRVSSPKTVSRTVKRDTLRAMLLVDSGDLASAKSLLEAEQAAGKKDPYRETLRAEVALYEGQFEEAEKLLRESSPQVSGVRSVSRWTLVRGQLHFWRHEYTSARDLFQGALRNCQYIDDRYGTALALYHLGQLERVLGHYDKAETMLTEAQSHLSEKGRRVEFLSGLIAHNLGICKQHQGTLDEAQEWYDTSLSQLRQTENGRCYGLALNSYGTLLEDRGEYVSALEALEEAANIAETQGISVDAAAVRLNLGRCLLQAEKLELAEVVLQQARELNIEIGDKVAECATLQLLAELYMEQNAVDKVAECAQEILALDEAVSDESQMILAQVMLARTYILRGKKEDARSVLLTALEASERQPAQSMKAQCLMYLAECCLPKRSPEAQSYLQQAEALLRDSPDEKFIGELERISTKAMHSRIRLTPDGDLIISKSFLPQWSEAKEAVESFLIKHSLLQSDDNNTRAAKILSISKVHLCEKRKQYGL